MSSHTIKPFSANNLLAALSPADHARLADTGERVSLKLRAMITTPNRVIDYIYFVESGMISLMQSLSDGSTTEVALIATEGFYGVPVLLGTRSAALEAVVQGDGSALRIPADAFANACEEGSIRKPLLRYAQALQIQISQSAACNGRHPLQERLARWLLEAHDRLKQPDLKLSHEFLSYMLASRRAGVTVALGVLREAGLIAMERNTIRILDRKGVEDASCECYATVRTEYRRLLEESWGAKPE